MILTKDIRKLSQKIKTPPPCLPTGFSGLDNMVGGCPLGQLVIVGARTSQGKSSFCIDISKNIAQSGVPVLFLTLEMGAITVLKRMCSSSSLVPLQRLKHGLTEDEEQRWSDAEQLLSEMKIAIEDESEFTTDKIIEKIRWFSGVAGGDFLVVLDYLGLIRPTERHSSRTYEIEETVSRFQREMKQHSGSLVVACQLNRETEKRDNPWPRLSDLRDSGFIEQAADMVWLLFRPDYYKQAEGEYYHDLTGEAQIIVAKNRHGPTGIVDCAFIPNIASFRDTIDGKLDVWSPSSVPPF